jgi:hypothetical protein
MTFISRVRAAFYCLIYGCLPVPVGKYSIICVGDNSMILATKTTSDKSLDVAMWALDRPDHYWNATSLGNQVHEEACR